MRELILKISISLKYLALKIEKKVIYLGNEKTNSSVKWSEKLIICLSDKTHKFKAKVEIIIVIELRIINILQKNIYLCYKWLPFLLLKSNIICGSIA